MFKLKNYANLTLKKQIGMFFKRSNTWNDLPDTTTMNCENAVKDLQNRINRASSESIPIITTSKFYPKPWWTQSLKQSKDKREKLYRRYRRERTIQTMLAWKRHRAAHKNLVKEAKRESWKDFTNTLTRNTPIKTLFNKARAIEGRQPRHVHILRHNNILITTIKDIANKLRNF